MKKKFQLFLLLAVWMTLSSFWMVSSSNTANSLIYFYSPTCDTCQSLSAALNRYSLQHRDLTVIRYDLSDLKNTGLLEKYDAAYHVDAKDTGIVPTIFIGNRYHVGSETYDGLSQLIADAKGEKTPVLSQSSKDMKAADTRFTAYHLASVFLAGLINGLSPCSLGMLLFLLSLLAVNKKYIVRVGSSFCAGIFLGYLLLGTTLFELLGKLDLMGHGLIIKTITLAVIVTLVLLNVRDFFLARRGQYQKMVVQLPNRLRKINYNIIGKLSKAGSLRILLIVSFGIGLFVSLGEFLCTGQIYLVTIVTILQTTASLRVLAVLYLVIYDIGFILPLIGLMLAVSMGREIFELSGLVRERLPIIKLINAIVFCILGIVIFLI